MYEQHFGLNKRLFSTAAVGSDVFVGPQTAVVLAGLKKALTVRDAIATVSGPAGCGKTTLVVRALQAAGKGHVIARIGRIRLDSHDVLELLTEALGLQNLPNGTIQRFTAFRKRLNELQGNGTQLFIVVEDSLRLGADTIAELEALTAADAGESLGASIVLMGDEQLQEFLHEPPLARVRQRIRHRQTITAFSVAELRGYLNHCFRLAGGDFERTLGTDATPVLHDLSGGIPRVANSLIESVLRAAAAQGLQQVPQQMLLDVAKEDFGLSAAKPLPVRVEKPASPVPETKDRLPTLEVSAEPQSSEPAVAVAAEKPESGVDTDASELIQDTLPNLSILTPEIVETYADVPDWERESTMAELRPDLNALEQAMAAATGGPTDQQTAPDPNSDDDKSPAKPAANVIPEITLDQAIKLRLEDSRIEKSEQSATVATAATAATETSKANASDSEIEKITAELAKTKSLEDMDDRMAETLFGGELDLAAAQFVKPAAESANDDSDAPAKPKPTQMDSSASTRLRTVQALNAADKIATPAKVEPKASSSPAIQSKDATEEPAPDSIEDQINTSITQTLKALSMPAPDGDDDDEDEDDEQSKGGFFSRFKRS